jgi:hypothetical protein
MLKAGWWPGGGWEKLAKGEVDCLEERKGRAEWVKGKCKESKNLSYECIPVIV